MIASCLEEACFYGFGDFMNREPRRKINDSDTDEFLPFAEYAIVWQKLLGQAITADGTSVEVIYQPSRQNLITFNDDFRGEIIVGNTPCKFYASGVIGLGDRYVDILIASLEIKPKTSPTNLL